jgi:hypothetical protein
MQRVTLSKPKYATFRVVMKGVRSTGVDNANRSSNRRNGSTGRSVAAALSERAFGAKA